MSDKGQRPVESATEDSIASADADPGNREAAKPAESINEATVVCVLGMHRSGTSLFASLLGEVGAYLGSDHEMLAPDDGNEFGYFELRRMVEINERLLRHFGGTWQNPPSLPASFAREPALESLRSEARFLIESLLKHGNLCAIKEPRFCLTLPFWQHVIPSPVRYVLCVRNPLEAAKSLSLRHKLPLEHCLKLWRHYTTEALRHTADEKRIIVCYGQSDELWQQQVERLVSFLSDLRIEPVSAADLCAKFRSKAWHQRVPLGQTLYPANTSSQSNVILYAALVAASNRHPLRDEALLALGTHLGAQWEDIAGHLRRREAPAEIDWALLARAEAAERQRDEERERAESLAVELDEQYRSLGDSAKAHAKDLRGYGVRVGELEQEIRRREADRAEAAAHNQLVTFEHGALVNSKAWRLTAPLRATRKLVANAYRFSRRQPIELNAHPLGEITDQGQGRLRFVARKPKPQMQLEFSEGELPAGPVLLRAQLRAEREGELTPRLHLDLRRTGYREDGVVILPEPVEGWLEAVVDFPHHVTGLRLGLGLQKGAFQVSHVSLLRITDLEAAARLAKEQWYTSANGPRKLLPMGMYAVRAWRRHGIAELVAQVRPQSQIPAEDGTYSSWVRRHATLSERDRSAIRTRLSQLEQKPRISVLMPVFDPDERWLRRAIDSVRNQLHDNWELCIADDCSTNRYVRPLLEEYARSDERIKLVLRDKNGNISAASNSALELATGEFVALLDHDDELTEHALYMVVEEINAFPNAKLIYSDEDKVGEDGVFNAPHFKPDWSPDLMRSYNMVNHLGVFSRDIIEEVAGFRIGYEGAQDYDLALRVVEHIAPEQIRHIPHVLYHWRSVPGSTARSSSEKEYAPKAGRRAVQSHLKRCSIQAEVTAAPNVAQWNRVRYALNGDRPKVSIIIPTRDRVDLLRVCVDSILERTRYERFEVLLIDNQSQQASTREYYKRIERDPRVAVSRYEHSFNFSALCNVGARRANGSVLVLLNNDIEVLEPEWLDEMVQHAVRPEIGAVGAMLYYPDDSIQHAGVVLGIGGVAGHVHKHAHRGSAGYVGRALVIQNYSAVTAACLAVRRSVFEEVGGFDESIRVAFNDVDFCLRVRERGYRNLWTPYAELYHHESATRGPDTTTEAQTRFAREIEVMQTRWGDQLVKDPFYNPNLTLIDETFSIASSPRAHTPWHS